MSLLSHFWLKYDFLKFIAFLLRVNLLSRLYEYRFFFCIFRIKWNFMTSAVWSNMQEWGSLWLFISPLFQVLRTIHSLWGGFSKPCFLSLFTGKGIAALYLGRWKLLGFHKVFEPFIISTFGSNHGCIDMILSATKGAFMCLSCFMKTERF